MRRVLLTILLALSLVGCPGFASVPKSAVEQSVSTNNALVGALTKIQTKVRADRKASMLAIAETAKSREEGEREIEKVDAAYAGAFEVFQKAEKVQGLLAKALETARAAIDAGEAPDLAKVLGLYAQVQSLYNEILTKLSELK